jgi:hypothetical protein
MDCAISAREINVKDSLDIKDRLTGLLNFSAFAVLLGVTTWFGATGRRIEMAGAIAASAVALAFLNLNKIRKFKGAGFEAEMFELEDKVDTMVAKQTEPDPEKAPLPLPTITPNMRTVLEALSDRRYTWRSIAGLASQTGLSKGDVQDAVKSLRSITAAKSTVNDPGKVTVALTSFGVLLAGIATGSIEKP